MDSITFTLPQTPPFVRRHQVFLIARLDLKGGLKAYRCVAALDHNYSHASYTVRATYRFLKTASRWGNASVIRAELQELNGKYGPPGAERQDDMPEMPCPYTASLLGASWMNHLDESTGSTSFDGITLTYRHLDVNLGCRAFPNDEGITVVDITEPTRPAYCMIKFSGSEVLTPLSAKEYLEAYYDWDGLSLSLILYTVILTICANRGGCRVQILDLLSLERRPSIHPSGYCRYPPRGLAGREIQQSPFG
ncbi:hypothetical protein BV20DRAFT_947019 [Pilatotrama ljubarskyi]|nr:hypothetical protein BV20DRAFT_947019 [Pilatotrama ljubarskyi]